MRWKKGTIPDNDGKKMDCWRSDCGTYLISQNYFNGEQWLYEVASLDQREKETWIADGKTLKEAKELAEFEREEVEAMNE